MNFRLVSKLVTLNDLERRNGRYFALAYLANLGSFSSRLHKSEQVPAELLK